MSIAEDLHALGEVIMARLHDIRDRIDALERGREPTAAMPSVACQHEPVAVNAMAWVSSGPGMHVKDALMATQGVLDDRGSLGGSIYAIRLCRRCKGVYWSEVP